MFDVNKAIYACDDVICRNIESFTTEQRGLLSQNILSQLRNFVENIFVKVYISLGGEPQRKDYDTIRVACSYVKALQGEYRFLSQFHKLLQISVSHYTLDPDSSERLMLKYYEYLLRIRILMKEKFGMKLLANLSQFPLNTDKTFTLYYKAIAYRSDILKFRSVPSMSHKITFIKEKSSLGFICIFQLSVFHSSIDYKYDQLYFRHCIF